MDAPLLSLKQEKLLRKLNKKSIINPDRRVEGLEYLVENNLAVCCSCDKPDDPFFMYHITDFGKAVLRQKNKEHLTLFLAIAGAVIALVGLLPLVA